MTPEEMNELIRSRRTIVPKFYTEKSIPEDIIWEILENANHAPTHRLTEPWRFKVFVGEGRRVLSEYLADFYQKNTPPALFSEAKYRKTQDSPMQSGCVMAICMRHDPQGRVPEWEELAAVAAAVQNMWLSCTAYGIGAYWSTPAAAVRNEHFPGLEEGEVCMGLFYMGYHEAPPLPGVRTAVREKVRWVRED